MTWWWRQAQAVAGFHNHAGKAQLLLTDVVLPDRRGYDLASELETACGDLKVIFISGYPENVVPRESLQAEGWSYLAKPFTAASLLRKVRKALKADVRPAKQTPKAAETGTIPEV